MATLHKIFVNDYLFHLCKIDSNTFWRIKIKIQILLYGIGRASPQLVGRSLDNLKTYWPADAVFHTSHIVLKVSKVDNPRSGEQYVQRELELFAPNVDKLVVAKIDDLEAQSSVQRSILTNYTDIYEDNGKSLNNLFNQLLLLEYCEKQLIEENKYDTVVFCRDDILVKKSPMFGFPSPKGNDIIMPGFHWHRGYNDRFMLGTSEMSKLWARRIQELKKFHQSHKKLSGETLVKFTLVKNNINVLAFPRVFPRIRHNDIICRERNPLSINRPREFF